MTIRESIDQAGTEGKGIARNIVSPFDGTVIGIEAECPECGITVKAHRGIDLMGFYYPKSVSCKHVVRVITDIWGGSGRVSHGRFVWKGRS